MGTRRVEFEGAFGDRLAARLELPEGQHRACALFAHCFTCSKDLKAVVRVSRALAERGFAVLRFDFTGLGESEGDFADTNFSSNLEDLEAAAEFARREFGGPELLIGHSLGGAAVLAAAARLEGVRAVATIGAPSDTEHVRQTLLSQAPELDSSSDEAEVLLAGRSFTVRRQLLEDLGEHRLAPAIGKLGKPLLILHSPSDEVVGIDHARRIYEAARHPKSFVSLDGADHLLLRDERDSHFVADLLAAWASRYVDLPETEVAESGDAQVVVRGGPTGFTNSVELGRHQLVADEPKSVGGADLGPNPYDLLLAALGACKSMTLRMYANRKGWPLEGIEVRLDHSKIHAADCEECETEKGRLDRIETAIRVEGPLDEEQRARLVEISERCPVHRTLQSEVQIVGRELVD
jgi:putative redox protein